MARKDVLTMTGADSFVAANDYMVGLFGDDPGSQEITLNAYLDGESSGIATHSIGVANCSQADATSLENYLAATTGCGSAEYPAGSGSDYWAEALRLWNLKPVVQQVP